MNDRQRSLKRNFPQDTRKSNDNRPSFNFDKDRIRLAGDTLPTDLLSQVAEDAAKYVADWDAQNNKTGKNASKPTQLRKFYDEICMWNDRTQHAPDHFAEYLPLILMLKAKVAYSKGRTHVNEAYYKMLNYCLNQLEQKQEPKTLRNLKLFMEAFTGFYKVYGPKN